MDSEDRQGKGLMEGRKDGRAIFVDLEGFAS